MLCYAKWSQSCLTLRDPMDCGLPGSSVHGILQARILEWVAMPSSSESQGWNLVLLSPMLAGRFFTTSTTWEAPLTALLGNKSQTMKSALFKVCSSGVFGIFQELYNCHHYFCSCQKKLQTQEQSLFTLPLASGNYQSTLSGFVCPGHLV